jgi:hypothetical protein
MADAVRFDVSNPQTPEAGAVIYISDDAAKWGRIHVTLTNQRTDNSDIKLAPDGVLKIYCEMLTPDDIKAITLPDNSAWAGGPDATNRHLALHPKQTIIVPSQSAITIELHNVLGRTPRQGKFRFYDAALGIRNAVVQGFVQRPPDDDASQWGLACILDPRVEYQNQGNTIYVTGAGKPDIANDLLVHLYRGASGTLPSAGTPRLSFSFLTGDNDLALCSEDRLKNVTASIQDQIPQGRWKSPAADTQGEDTVWTVAPADGGGDLFPEDSLLILRFDGIVTDLPPGSSTLFIQYSDLAGYDDGYIQVPLSKTTAVPYVRYFRAKADGKDIGANATVDYAALTLEWDVFAAESCALKGDDEAEAKTVARAGSEPLVPRASQIYTLQPQIGSQTLPATQVQFHIAPPVADLTSGPDTSDAVWTLMLWRGFATSADNCGYAGLDGSDIPLTLKEQFNGTAMLGTEMQTVWNADGPIREYEVDRWCRGALQAGGIDATVLIGPPVVRWSCRSGTHCVLYRGDVTIADGLPLSGELPAQLDTTYRIECVGIGRRSASTTTAATPARASATFVLSCGPDLTIDWSVAGAASFQRDIQVTAGDVLIGKSSTGTHTVPAPAQDSHYILRLQGDLDVSIVLRQQFITI